MDWLFDVGFDDIVLVLGYKHEQIEEIVGDDPRIRIFINYDMIPTVQYLLTISDQLEDPFLLTNGDTLTNLNLLEFIEFHMVNKNIATAFTEHDAIHTGGTYVLDREALKYANDGDNVPDLMKRLVEKQIPVNLFFSNAKYFDTANMAKLRKAREYYAR